LGLVPEGEVWQVRHIRHLQFDDTKCKGIPVTKDDGPTVISGGGGARKKMKKSATESARARRDEKGQNMPNQKNDISYGSL